MNDTIAKVYQTITVDDIPDSSTGYEGYYWLSDAERPVMVTPERPLDRSVFALPRDPFVVEANLYDATHKISIHIQYLNGAYQVTRFDLAGAEYEEQEYLAHDVAYEKYRMAEGWERVKDTGFSEVLGREVKVWQPVWEAFIGFVDQ